MSGILPDNALLAWLQDDTNNAYQSEKELAGMHSYFSEDVNDPTDSIKEDDRHHCFIIFEKNEFGNAECVVLHHLAQHPTQMGVTTIYDWNWYLMGNGR